MSKKKTILRLNVYKKRHKKFFFKKIYGVGGKMVGRSVNIFRVGLVQSACLKGSYSSDNVDLDPLYI